MRASAAGALRRRGPCGVCPGRPQFLDVLFLFFGAPRSALPPSALRGHVRRMGPERLPRLMLSAWVAHKRPAGAPQLTYGRTVAKAMDTFDLDPARWPELAADRGAWRTMLRSGEAPLGFRQAPPPPVPMPMSHFLVRPRRAAATHDAHQRRDRRVEARRERQLLTTSRCAACPSL